MPNTAWFPSPTVFSGALSDYFILAIMVLLGALVIYFFAEQDKHDPNVHSPMLAWLRGGMFFCAAFIVSWCTGVFGKIVSSPIATPQQLADPLWIGMTVTCIGLVLWGYFYWWPKGTVTHERESYPLPSLLFGATWGLSAAQLQLVLFAILEEFQFGRVATGILVFLLYGTYNLNFQQLWWDIRVSPPHNIRATNTKKVLYSHMPFLIASLAYFTLFGNAAIFVMLQATALAAAVVAMRFPPFWAPDGKEPVSRKTAIGI